MGKGLHYVLVLCINCGAYGLVMAVLFGKRLLRAMKTMNRKTQQEAG